MHSTLAKMRTRKYAPKQINSLLFNPIAAILFRSQCVQAFVQDELQGFFIKIYRFCTQCSSKSVCCELWTFCQMSMVLKLIATHTHRSVVYALLLCHITQTTYSKSDQMIVSHILVCIGHSFLLCLHKQEHLFPLTWTVFCFSPKVFAYEYRARHTQQ